MKHDFLPPQRPRGVALMAVLWLIAILAMACMTTLRVISFDMEIATAKVHGSRARQMAEMGIAIGSNPAVKRSDPILRQLNAETGEGFEARVVSEGGRFNINSTLMQGDKELLTSMFVNWGLDVAVAQGVVDSLIDWIDTDDDEQMKGAEKKYYEGIGRINQPFNHPFYDLSEMSLVRGMELVEAVRPDWRNWFTVWSSGGLDLNEATPELIAAAAEIPAEQAEIIPETVAGLDGIKDTTDDVPFQNPSAALDLLGIDPQGRPDLSRRFTTNDPTTRVESIGYAEGVKRKISIIIRNRTGKPALLERTEEIIP
ncbi:MAG: type II secretion system protein GspK [Akkermansiaceae bacterium]|nr:type II secretion system protein GspK [Akkermansiaceae bacterium]